MMQKKSVKKNYIYNLIYQILISAIPLITAPYLSRVLGAENIGIYSFTISISSYFILFGTLGLTIYGQREIAYNQNDSKKYSKTFWEIFILRFLTTTISLFLFFFTCVLNSNSYSIYFLILMLEIFANSIDISWFFQGHEEFKKILIRNLIIKSLGIISIFIFVKTQNDLNNYFLIYALSLLLGNLSLWTYMPKFLTKINIKTLNFKRHIKPTIKLFLPQIAIQVYIVLDKTMIGLIIPDKSQSGYYEQASKIIKTALMIITSLGTVMIPRMSNLHASNKKGEMLETLKKSLKFVFLMAIPMIFGILLVTDTFVPLYFGEGYEDVKILMKILSLILLEIGMSNIIGYGYLLPAKKEKYFTISVTAGAAINLIFNLILISLFGTIGACISTIIAEGTVTIIQLVLIRKDLPFLQSAKHFFKPMAASTAATICCIPFYLMEINNIFKLLLLAAIFIFVYAFMLFILKEEFTLTIVNKAKIKLKKN